MGEHIHIIGGGTFSYVRNHLALSAPAWGKTARRLDWLFAAQMGQAESETLHLHLTKMADPLRGAMVTNEDVEKLLDKLIADPDTRVIILNAALCDYDGTVLSKNEEKEYLSGIRTESGSHARRLKTSDGEQKMILTPANKLIGKIRKERKDIFVVGFKTTTGATSDEQYRTALDMLKRDSLNLVVANDTVTRNNMIVAPEETRYSETTDREDVLQSLVKMVLSRSKNTFTRSTVVEGESVSWDSPLIPDNLREVVNYCIENGAYKTFRGVTAGHFAVKIDDNTILTSKRKQDFNRLAEIGLVRVEYEDDTRVIAYGAKPSVGGQSQRIVFREHPDLDCIVHFHCPPRLDYPSDIHPGYSTVNVVPQWQNECGSHQCGANTSGGLREEPGFNGKLKAVMLANHGPNIVFSRDVPAKDVIAFIESSFDLKQKTGGLVAA